MENCFEGCICQKIEAVSALNNITPGHLESANRVWSASSTTTALAHLLVYSANGQVAKLRCAVRCCVVVLGHFVLETLGSYGDKV